MMSRSERDLRVRDSWSDCARGAAQSDRLRDAWELGGQQLTRPSHRFIPADTHIIHQRLELSKPTRGATSIGHPA